MPASLICRFQPASAADGDRAGVDATSPIDHMQHPANRVVCRTLLSATNALRTA